MFILKLLIKPRILITSFGGIVTIILIGIHTNYINEKHIRSIGLKKDYEEQVIDYHSKTKNLLSIMEGSILSFVNDVFEDDTSDLIKNKMKELKDAEKNNQAIKEIVDKFNAKEK